MQNFQEGIKSCDMFNVHYPCPSQFLHPFYINETIYEVKKVYHFHVKIAKAVSAVSFGGEQVRQIQEKGLFDTLLIRVLRVMRVLQVL